LQLQRWHINHFPWVRQSFSSPDSVYFNSYKYESGIVADVFYGKKKTFQEWVEYDKRVVKNQVKKLNRLLEKIDLLKYGPSFTKNKPSQAKIDLLLLLLSKFHKVAQNLRDRYNDRETLIIRDEYDVQDLLNSLFQLHFEDIRKEEYSPSSAGANSRIDFVLKEEKIIIEVKITSEKVSTNKLGQDLLVDIGRYKEYPDCNDLVIFIYDKGDLIRNKFGFLTDLEKQSTPSMNVRVIINPM